MSCTPRIIALAAAAAIFVAGSCLALRPAVAQPAICMPAAIAEARLQAEYGEAPIGAGVAGGRLAVLYTSRDGATWTIAIRDPERDVLCIVLFGEAWEVHERAPEGEPS